MCSNFHTVAVAYVLPGVPRVACRGALCLTPQGALAGVFCQRGLDETKLPRAGHRLDATGGGEFGQDVLHMSLGGIGSDHQLGSNLLI